MKPQVYSNDITENEFKAKLNNEIKELPWSCDFSRNQDQCGSWNEMNQSLILLYSDDTAQCGERRES